MPKTSKKASHPRSALCLHPLQGRVLDGMVTLARRCTRSQKAGITMAEHLDVLPLDSQVLDSQEQPLAILDRACLHPKALAPQGAQTIEQPDCLTEPSIPKEKPKTSSKL